MAQTLAQHEDIPFPWLGGVYSTPFSFMTCFCECRLAVRIWSTSLISEWLSYNGEEFVYIMQVLVTPIRSSCFSSEVSAYLYVCWCVLVMISAAGAVLCDMRSQKRIIIVNHLWFLCEPLNLLSTTLRWWRLSLSFVQGLIYQSQWYCIHVHCEWVG